jgi:RimJ/RimL family protein N-acetyltransferase
VVIALIHPDNDASKHVARKLGFAYERDTEFHGRTVELFVLEA